MTSDTIADGVTASTIADNKRERLKAIDIFRGLCIVGMVLVNLPGDPDHAFNSLRHVEWSGWVLADLVAPGFLWVVGLVVPLAIGKHLDQGLARGQLQHRILRRSLILYALGILLDTGLAFDYVVIQGNWSGLPVLGILQRIAVCYLVVATAFLWGGLRGALAALVGCLAVYLGILWGYVLVQDGANPFGYGSNLSTWFEGVILGDSFHAAQGLVTVFTGSVTSLSGVLVGVYLRSAGYKKSRRFAVLYLIGLTSIGLGYVLDPWMPINRYLWTPSFVLLSSGISMAFFAFLDCLVSMRGFVRWGNPLTVIGRNPITVYVLAEIVGGALHSMGVTRADVGWVSVWYYGYLELIHLGISPRFASAAVPFILLLSLYLVALMFDRRGWHVRV